MKSEWSKVTLLSVCSRLSSGKSISSKLLKEKGDVPVYGGNGVRGYIEEGENFNGECAIIGRQGAYCGNVRFFSGKAYMTEHAIVVQSNECTDTRFLAYKLSLMQLGRLSGQSAQPGLSVKVLGEQVIDIPPLPIQRKIASILSALDDKIETNNAICRNLEEQMFALYRELFIRTPKKEWQHGYLSDLGEVVGGGTPSKKESSYYTEHGIPWITPKDLSRNKSKFFDRGEIDITQKGLMSSGATILPKGTVLFSSRAPIGYIAIANNEVTTNQGFKSVIPHSFIGSAFLYYFLKYNTPVISQQASGSTFPEISTSAMRQIPAILPDQRTLDIFNDFCKPEFQRQEELEKESVFLSQLRDSLLPKLMSGELSVEGIN